MVIPTGTVLTYFGTTDPDGFLLTNGRWIQKTNFYNLYQFAKREKLNWAETTDQIQIPMITNGIIKV